MQMHEKTAGHKLLIQLKTISLISCPSQSSGHWRFLPRTTWNFGKIKSPNTQAQHLKWEPSFENLNYLESPMRQTRPLQAHLCHSLLQVLAALWYLQGRKKKKEQLEWIQISKHRFYSMQSVGTVKYILVLDLKTPYKAPWKSQIAFEAEMRGEFVTFRAKNHLECSCFLPELCLEMRGITRPGKSRQSLDWALNTRSKRRPELFKLNPQELTDSLGHSQTMKKKTIIWGINRVGSPELHSPSLGTHGRRWSRKRSHNLWAISLTKCFSLLLMGHSEPLALVPAWLGRDRKMCLVRNTHGNTAGESQHCSAPQNSTSPLPLGTKSCRKIWSDAKSQG